VSDHDLVVADAVLLEHHAPPAHVVASGKVVT